MARPAEPAADDPTTLERDRVVSKGGTRGAFRIELVSGGPSVAYDLDQPGRIFVGTSESCEVRAFDRLVSRRHLALEIDGDHLRVTDLGSTNGTFCGGLRIVEALLDGGELLSFGDASLRVTRRPSSAKRLPAAARFGRVLGQSPAMRTLYPLCERLALSNVPLVIEGETGTGKELLAEAIHEGGPRANGPFVVFDCTTGPSTLLEAILFGHERGAFTGADVARAGVFERAHGGTLFIDEIGDLDLALQAKLLRAVQKGEVQRLGSAAWIKSDVRVIAATRRDLERAVQEGRFRDDLFFRLAVARIELPALRRRQGDVALLAEAFFRAQGSAMPAEFVQQYAGYGWPGNVRELANVVARRVALGELADHSAIRGGSVPPPSSEAERDLTERLIAGDVPFVTARQRVLDDFERRYVEHVLRKHGGNVSKAAAASGIARRYFYTVRARSER
jgi:DNA-binding NtrC family response regulator